MNPSHPFIRVCLTQAMNTFALEAKVKGKIRQFKPELIGAASGDRFWHTWVLARHDSCQRREVPHCRARTDGVRGSIRRVGSQASR
jgi:hypothetical protein